MLPPAKRDVPLEQVSVGPPWMSPLEYREMKHLFPHLEQKYPCPFCKENQCDHWNGIGWVNPKFADPLQRNIRDFLGLAGGKAQ